MLHVTFRYQLTNGYREKGNGYLVLLDNSYFEIL